MEISLVKIARNIIFEFKLLFKSVEFPFRGSDGNDYGRKVN
jgi:hypothetical protein